MADDTKQGFLNSLFQWTLKNTASEAATSSDVASNSDVQPMDEDKKKWLDDALENLTVNPIERIKLCINKIKDNETSEEQKKEFLDELCHWAEELDLAKDFFTLGGLDILSPLLDATNDEIRTETCALMANLVQNNEHCQRIIVQSGLQQKLLNIVSQSDNPEVKTKAVTAISALIRGYTLGQLQLQKYHGPKVLIEALSAPIPRLQNKLCFLINTICSSSAHMKKLFYENGALPAFIRLFNSEECPDHHHTLETILTLSSIKPNAMSLLCESDAALTEQFHQKLTERRQLIQGSEEQLDEIDLINRIRTLLTPSSTENNSTPGAKPSQEIVPRS